METGGFTLHCGDIRELARQLLMMRVARGFSMPYRDGCPGHNWLTGFLKRHPGNVSYVTLCEQYSIPVFSCYEPQNTY